MTSILGLDGRALRGTIPADGCCPPSICNINPCGLVCAFVHALPSGPLWDRQKAEAIARYQGTTLPAECGARVCEPACGSMVDHAIYTAIRLYYHGLVGALATALREANPYTAVDTIDAWLERLGWRDCYDCACRDGAVPGLSPIEIWGPIGTEGICEGPICCPQEYSEDLRCAVKRGTVIALHRLTLMPRRTVDAINWVIAPLGARLDPVCYRDIPLDPQTCNEDDGTTLCLIDAPADQPCPDDVETDPWRCADPEDACDGSDTLGGRYAPTLRQFTFRVCPLGERMTLCREINCRDGSVQETIDPVTASPLNGPTVQAWYEPTACGDGTLPNRVWPGVLAAECIARSALPRGQKITLTRCV